VCFAGEINADNMFFLKPWFFSPDGSEAVTLAKPDQQWAVNITANSWYGQYPDIPAELKPNSIRARNLAHSQTKVYLSADKDKVSIVGVSVGQVERAEASAGGDITYTVGADYRPNGTVETAVLKTKHTNTSYHTSTFPSGEVTGFQDWVETGGQEVHTTYSVSIGGTVVLEQKDGYKNDAVIEYRYAQNAPPVSRSTYVADLNKFQLFHLDIRDSSAVVMRQRWEISFEDLNGDYVFRNDRQTLSAELWIGGVKEESFEFYSETDSSKVNPAIGGTSALDARDFVSFNDGLGAYLGYVGSWNYGGSGSYASARRGEYVFAMRYSNIGAYGGFLDADYYALYPKNSFASVKSGKYRHTLKQICDEGLIDIGSDVGIGINPVRLNGYDLSWGK